MIADPSCRKCTPAHARSCGGQLHISSIVTVIRKPEGCSSFFLKDTLLGSLHCPSVAHRHTSSECNLRRPSPLLPRFYCCAAVGRISGQSNFSPAQRSLQPSRDFVKVSSAPSLPAQGAQLLVCFFSSHACRLELLEMVVEVLWSGVGRPRETMAGCRQGTVRGRLISCKATKQSTRRHATATPIRKSLAPKHVLRYKANLVKRPTASTAKSHCRNLPKTAKTHVVANICVVLRFSNKNKRVLSFQQPRFQA